MPERSEQHILQMVDFHSDLPWQDPKKVTLDKQNQIKVLFRATCPMLSFSCLNKRCASCAVNKISRGTWQDTWC